MDFETAGRQIGFARQTPYRKVFEQYVGKYPHTLSDKDLALVFHVSTGRATENSKIQGVLETVLPDKGCEHFNTLREMATTRGPFFTRFVLFTKTIIDGLLVGFGTDEMYYVVATWDERGCDLWQPKHGLYDRPVLA